MLDPGFPAARDHAVGPAGPAVREVLAAARERSAEVTVLAEPGYEPGPGERVLAVEPGPEWLSPLRAVVPAQLLAVGAAERLGLDVDHPHGLHKITRTT